MKSIAGVCLTAGEGRVTLVAEVGPTGMIIIVK